jgi:amidase
MRPPGAVIDAAPYLSDADEVFRVQRAARMAELAPLLRAHRDQIKPALAANIEQGIALTGEQVAAAQLKRARSSAGSGRSWPTAATTCRRCPPSRSFRSQSSRKWVTQINGEPMATYIDWIRSCSRITVTARSGRNDGTSCRQ